MKFEVDGIDETMQDFQDITDNADELSESQLVPDSALFTSSFMQQYTKFESYDAFLDNSGFDVSSQESMDAIPGEEMDKYVAENTDFDSWEEMQGQAVDEYLADGLDL